MLLLSSGTPARYTSIPATFTSFWFYFCFFSMTFTSTAFAFMDYYFYLLICYFFEAPTWIAPLSGGNVLLAYVLPVFTRTHHVPRCLLLSGESDDECGE